MIKNLFFNLATNKHTSVAAIIYAGAKWGCPILGTWWPSKKSQLDATAQILEGLAVFYGFAAAGDGAASLSKQEADTSFIRKDQTKP